MIDILNKIARLFRTDVDPKAKHFDSLKELREFQRNNPGYVGPLWLYLDDKVSEDKRGARPPKTPRRQPSTAAATTRRSPTSSGIRKPRS